MTTLLITLTILEIAIVLLVLVGYLIAIAKSLRRTSELLGKVAFGVRAIETQCESVGPAVVTLNERLETVAGALADLSDLTQARTPARSGRS